MATRILIRRGPASQIPILESGEPGWVTNLYELLIGDGSATPPKIPTTKSMGAYDFGQTEWFRFKEIRMVPNGRVDGVDISELIKGQGILVSTSPDPANPELIQRQLVGAAGHITITHPRGIAGDPTIALHPDIIEKINQAGVGYWTSIERPVAPVLKLGMFGYNADLAVYEGFVHEAAHLSASWWQLPLVLPTGRSYTYGVHFSSMVLFREWIKYRSYAGAVRLVMPAGVTGLVDPAWRFDDVLANRVEIAGQPPEHMPLAADPIVAITGSSGNYLVTYQMSGPLPANLVTGSYVVIDSHVIGQPGMSSASTTRALEANDAMSRTKYTIGNNLRETGIDVGRSWVVTINRAAPKQLLARRVVNTSQDDITINAGFGVPAVSPAFIVMNEIPGATCNSTAGDDKITIGGVNATHWLEPGDIICPIGASGNRGRFYRVQTVNANFVKTYSVSDQNVSSGILLVIKNNWAGHCGCWRVHYADPVNRRITVNNTCFQLPPARFDVKKLDAYFVPSIVLRNNGESFIIQRSSSQRLVISDLVILPLAAHGSNGISVTGSDIEFDGIVGITMWKRALVLSASRCLVPRSCILAISRNSNPQDYLDDEDAYDEDEVRSEPASIIVVNSILNAEKLIVTGNYHAPLMIKSGSTFEITRMMVAGNYGYGMRVNDSIGYVKNSWFTGMSPGETGVIVGASGSLLMSFCTMLGPTDTVTLRGGAVRVHQGVIDMHNCLLFSNNRSTFKSIRSGKCSMRKCYIANFVDSADTGAHYCVQVTHGGELFAASTNFMAYSRVLSAVQGSNVNLANCGLDGRYERVADVSGGSEFNAHACYLPDGTASGNPGILASGLSQVIQMSSDQAATVALQSGSTAFTS